MKDKPAARDRGMAGRLRRETLAGFDIVPGVVRLATMNLYLHGIGGEERSPIHRTDALLADPGTRWDYVLTNPPFGRKQSSRSSRDDGDVDTEARTTSAPILR